MDKKGKKSSQSLYTQSLDEQRPSVPKLPVDRHRSPSPNPHSYLLSFLRVAEASYLLLTCPYRPMGAAGSSLSSPSYTSSQVATSSAPPLWSLDNMLSSITWLAKEDLPFPDSMCHPDIIRKIIQCSPRTLLATFMRVNRESHETAGPLLYRHVSIGKTHLVCFTNHTDSIPPLLPAVANDQSRHEVA